MRYRVWLDPHYDRHFLESDGVELEAISPDTAVQSFAEARYRDYQHVDPGMVLVRDLETGEVTRWSVDVRISFVVDRRSAPPTSAS
jgi:hypothetical protein